MLTIALVGRPNVGKSTLFNCLTKTRNAIVANLSGLTRDRQYGRGQVGDKPYIVIDTGGLSYEKADMDDLMAQQSLTAIAEADAVLFLVDAKTGCTAGDELITTLLRKENKKIYLVVNKTDGVDNNFVQSEFSRLGFGVIHSIAAAHGRGVSQLVTHFLASLPEPQSSHPQDELMGIKIAITGRPNVGKSTLVNHLLGEERVAVYDEAGTTRDAIYIPYERKGKNYTLIDTAGMRRRGKIQALVEKFSVVKTIKAIQDAHVVVFLIDATEGVVDQDLTLLNLVEKNYRALVIGLNKWDETSAEQKEAIKSTLSRRLHFVQYAKIHPISAKFGNGIERLYRNIEQAYQSATRRWTTNQLNNFLKKITTEHPPPVIKGHRVKLRYCHMGGSNPPSIVIHGNQVDELPEAYRRYLQNAFSGCLKVVGTPIKIDFKRATNPYAGRKNTLNLRQRKKRERLMRYVKK